MPDLPASPEDRARATVREAVLATLNQMEDVATRDNDPDLVFEIMALKERLGLPTTR